MQFLKNFYFSNVAISSSERIYLVLMTVNLKKADDYGGLFSLLAERFPVTMTNPEIVMIDFTVLCLVA